MKPTQAHFFEAEYVINHPFEFAASYVRLCLAFRRYWGVK